VQESDSSEESDSGGSTLLECKDIGKSFPGVRALGGVNLSLDKGQVLSLIGENGAGKSTLMKILAGVQPPDEGEILLDGKKIEIESTRAALDLGISLIHQELNLATNLSVGANVFLGREPLRGGLIDESTIRRESAKYLEMVGLAVSPDTLVGDLTIGRQQMVEISKALSVNARVLIMDEPTSSLSQAEAENLFVVIKNLRARGVSVIYISHRLGEVKELSDHVTVLRDGENAGELSREEVTHEAMVRLMVGRDLSEYYERKDREKGDIALEVKGLRTPVHPKHELSFSVASGEIIGVAGLVGAGRTEMLEALFGVTPALSGSIRVSGTELELDSPISAIAAGIALAPEDRKQQGLVIDMTVRENLSLAALRRDQKKAGFLDFSKEKKISEKMIEAMRVKTPNENQVIRYLSGGNQQKVVLGKWLAMKPKILLLDEPTRGIDVGAKSEIYALMEELAESGVAILYVSSEMEEILGMADRALVMHEGRITGELSRAELTEENVMHLATGGEKTAA
jgi:ribose transport system ATP-binding protein